MSKVMYLSLVSTVLVGYSSLGKDGLFGVDLDCADP